MKEKPTTTVGEYLQDRAEKEARAAGFPLEEKETEPKDVKEDKKESSDTDTIRLKDGTTVTKQELIDGYLRRSDYTKKTMSLADDKKAFEARKAELEAFVANMDAYYHDNPKAYQEVIDHFKGVQGEDIPVEDKSSKTQDKKEVTRNYEYDKKINNLTKEIDSIKQKQSEDKAQSAVDKAVAKFVSKHQRLSEENIDEILRIAQENVVPNKSADEVIDNAYKMWEYENLKKARTASQEEQRLQKVSAQYFGGGDKGGLKRKTDGELLKEVIFQKRPENIL